MRYPFLRFIVVLILSCRSAHSADPESSYRVPAKWAGSWELSPEANKLLGLASEEDRTNAGMTHPQSFTLTFDNTLGESLDKENFEGYRDQIFTEKFGHRIVATGAWKIEFEEDQGLKEDGFFLTIKNGNTFLWKPAAYIILYGGTISFVEGADQSRDLLVIEFNPQPSEFPRHETVVYRRAAAQPAEEKPELELNSGILPAERIQAVRKTYRDVPPDILGGQEPIKVLWSDILFDGGTIFVKAEDAEERVFHMTLKYDETYLKFDTEDQSAWMRNYQTQRIQFDFSQNVNSGPYYAIRGPEEAAIYGLLIRWSENPNYEPVGKDFKNSQKHWTEMFLAALDYRFASSAADE